MTRRRKEPEDLNRRERDIISRGNRRLICHSGTFRDAVRRMIADGKLGVAHEMVHYMFPELSNVAIRAFLREQWRVRVTGTALYIPEAWARAKDTVD